MSATCSVIFQKTKLMLLSNLTFSVELLHLSNSIFSARKKKNPELFFSCFPPVQLVCFCFAPSIRQFFVKVLSVELMSTIEVDLLMYRYTSVHLHAQTQAYTCMHKDMRTHAHICTQTSMHIHMHQIWLKVILKFC